MLSSEKYFRCSIFTPKRHLHQAQAKKGRRKRSSTESCAPKRRISSVVLQGAIWAPGIFAVFYCSYACFAMENEIAKLFLSKLVQVSKQMSFFPEQSKSSSKSPLIKNVRPQFSSAKIQVLGDPINFYVLFQF